MDRRTKATLHRDMASQLMASWNTSVAQSRYSDSGNWYALLTRFPAALVDANGYLLFETEDAFRSSPHLNIRKQIGVKPPGISALPGYIQILSAGKSAINDVDIHEYEGIEGRNTLLTHLARERDRRLVHQKRSSATSLACEICGFSFAAAYGGRASDYCEVHHLVPLAGEMAERKTLLQELAVLCANCHRVVHLKNPPYTLQEVKSMLMGPK